MSAGHSEPIPDLLSSSSSDGDWEDWTDEQYEFEGQWTMDELAQELETEHYKMLLQKYCKKTFEGWLWVATTNIMLRRVLTAFDKLFPSSVKREISRFLYPSWGQSLSGFLTYRYDRSVVRGRFLGPL